MKNKLIIVAIISLFILSGCEKYKVGWEYRLVMGTAITRDKDVIERLVKFGGTSYYTMLVDSDSNTQRVPFPGMDVKFVKQDGKACVVETKTGVQFYVRCKDIQHK